jgi:hypothetical protein
MATADPTPLERDEYIEQEYFFRAIRDRMAANVSAQEVLERVHEELLSTTRLPYAVQFLATELKHSGLLSSGFARLSHYFTPFQTFVIDRTEQDNSRFNIETALLLLERQAHYLAKEPTAAGLFVYQFEGLSRNRLGYDQGLRAMSEDPFYNDDWKAFIGMVWHHAGSYEFADIVYVRSEWYLSERRRKEPDYESPVAALFGEKEGKIARASHGRDPLFLFAALQRQLGYPEVPRAKTRDDLSSQVEALKLKLQQTEQRLALLESEVRGQIDLKQWTAVNEQLSGKTPKPGDFSDD